MGVGLRAVGGGLGVGVTADVGREVGDGLEDGVPGEALGLAQAASSVRVAKTPARMDGEW